MNKIITVASGKGGTGKTTSAGAISSCLAKLGHRCVCIDCDVGLRNLDLTLGLTDAATTDFSDVLAGRADLESAMIAHPMIENLFFLPSPPDIRPEDVDRDAFGAMIAEIRETYEFCILDAPAGLGAGFALAASAADAAVIVATIDAASLRDGQRTCAELHRYGIEDIRLLVNRVDPYMFKKSLATVDDIIDVVGAQLIGMISDDETVTLAANLEMPLILYPGSAAAQQYMRVARRITGERVPLGKF